MKVFDDAWNRKDLPRGAVATVGNYDGVHRGQRAILEKVVARGRELEVPAAVVTFAPHPAKVLWPERAPRCLTTPDQKQRLLSECGIDLAFLVRFDAEFAQTPAREFVERFLHERLDLLEIYVGSRFVFGRGREGDLGLLQRLGGDDDRGSHPAWGVEEVTAGGSPISSTRIREAVATGQVELAASMLGRPYEITGTVVHGSGKGHELGWPTINLEHDNELIPAHGVYVSRVRLEDAGGELVDHRSVANVGVRPTLHENSPPTVECHLLDFDGDLYGRAVRVEFLKRLRGEQVFSSLESLQAQIEKDVSAARRHFTRNRVGKVSVG
ncbi:MAG: bifunctional riboflavin kinase/FAD synthetase [bacterium]|nr:bifunctional riboflavin kinase/FAD synthetase [bacterium]